MTAEGPNQGAMSWNRLFVIVILAVLLFGLSPVKSKGVVAQTDSATLTLLNRQGRQVERISDGDSVQLRVKLSGKAPEDHPVQFALDEGPIVAECVIEQGKDFCETEALNTLGWFWTAAGTPAPRRLVTATTGGPENLASIEVSVHPRPVVMVHGFSSSWEAWTNYLGVDGFLAEAQIPGFAVGDGLLPGAMNTGRIDDPSGMTNTIAENAAFLGEYIQAVKDATGAEKVDLLAHSMGGLISRYYIGKVMQDRDVGQLIMLGSPMAGTECANLPASLGLYLPAVLEIRPAYVRQIFNPMVNDRRGVPFFALAGTLIQEPVQSPCTQVPTDLAVSLASVSAIPLHLDTMPVLHTDLNESDEVFSEAVLPILKRPAGAWIDPEDTQSPPSQVQAAGFSQILTGHVDPGGSETVTVHIDENVGVASFSLYDQTRSLLVTVRGASGNIIDLDPIQNGFIVVQDPEALIYLGYGFENPRPGPWQITLSAGPDTPPQGADFSMMARLTGGAQLQALTSALLPNPGDEVLISARLSLADQSLPIQEGWVVVHGADGYRMELPLNTIGQQAEVAWEAGPPGVYGINVFTRAQTGEGIIVERGAQLSVQVQPRRGLSKLELAAVTGLCLTGIAVGGAGAGFYIRQRRKKVVTPIL